VLHCSRIGNDGSGKGYFVVGVVAEKGWVSD